MLKKLLVAGSIVMLLGGYSYASNDESFYVHIGISKIRVISRDTENKKIHGFLQVNGALSPSVAWEDTPLKDWRKRTYFLVGINGKDYIAGIGYYGIPRKVGIQIADYYNKKTNKDYFCFGIYWCIC